MAVNETRSLNDELGTGMVSGKYKSVRPSWGGVVEPLTAKERMQLHPDRYDIREAPVKCAPDGTTR